MRLSAKLFTENIIETLNYYYAMSSRVGTHGTERVRVLFTHSLLP